MLTSREIKVNFASLSGQQALIFRTMTATEGLSQLFEFRVELLSHSHSVDLDAVLGKEMSISVQLSNGKDRHFHGYVASFSYAGSEGEMALYRAVLRPHLWRLTRARDCRVFQHKSVPVIVMEFLKDKHQLAHIDSHLGHPNRGDYLPWDFCVQYRETDFNFVSRLLEHEGIHYFFKHEVDKHTLVLADSLAGHSEVPGYENIIFRRGASQEHYDEGIWTWNSTRMVLPGTYAGRDFDFTTPTAKLHRASGSEVERKHAMAVTPDYEIYDYPEPIVQQNNYAPDDIQDYARIRIEEQHAQYEVISAETNARGLLAGALFKVTDGPRDEMAKTEYLIIESSTLLHMDSYRSGGDSEVTYQSSIRAINSKHNFRPPRTAPKPLIQGPQSAVVVGKSGEKVDTDSYGRVRVQFHWDRDGKSNEDTSCWVRVSQNWAGANWGGMFLPHIGQEVLVGFMEGDPDRPIVVGRVYNANNMPPLKLPDNKHKSIIRDHFGNEIVMDGTPGGEHMSFHSPSHHSVLQIGKSITKFTTSKEATYSYDTESYNFGQKLSYTKGVSFSVDKGTWLGIKAGAGSSVTLGSELAVSAGTKLSLTFGGAVTVSASWSCAWGYARELRFTKGSYRRSSGSDVLIDSRETVFITGGENDNTMIQLDNHHMALSFDESDASARTTQMDAAEAKIKKYTVAATAAVGVLSGLSIWAYQSDVSERGPVKSKDAKTDVIEMDYEKVSEIAGTDFKVAGAVAIGGVLGLAAFPGEAENPKHPSPQSMILLKKDILHMFAGKEQESELILAQEDGIVISSKKQIDLKSEEEGVVIAAKKELTLKSDDAVNIDAVIKHRNIVVKF